MPSALTEFTLEEYKEAERQYELQETIEDIMESVPQSRQRSSFYGLVMLHSDFPDLGVYNEILILYPAAGRIGEVCADNMLVRGDHHDPQTDQRGSFRVALESGTIFLVAEYVSESNPNKDRPGGESFLKYERDLKVAYYLLFDQYDHNQPLRLFHHNGEQYELVPANSEGRFPVTELFLETGVIGNMVRYWHRGELLPVYEEIPEIMWDKNGVIADQQDLLEDKAQQIAEQEGQIAKKEEVIAKKEEVIAKKEEVIAEKEEVIAEKEEVIAEKEEVIAEKEEVIAEQTKQLADQEELARRLREAIATLIQEGRSDLLPELATIETLKDLQEFMARLSSKS